MSLDSSNKFFATGLSRTLMLTLDYINKYRGIAHGRPQAALSCARSATTRTSRRSNIAQLLLNTAAMPSGTSPRAARPVLLRADWLPLAVGAGHRRCRRDAPSLRSGRDKVFGTFPPTAEYMANGTALAAGATSVAYFYESASYPGVCSAIDDLDDLRPRAANATEARRAWATTVGIETDVNAWKRSQSRSLTADDLEPIARRFQTLDADIVVLRLHGGLRQVDHELRALDYPRAGAHRVRGLGHVRRRCRHRRVVHHGREPVGQVARHHRRGDGWTASEFYDNFELADEADLPRRERGRRANASCSRWRCAPAPRGSSARAALRVLA